jgi:FMN reductase
MTVSTTTGGAPLVVGLGGTLRANSSTERALRYCLDSVERQGGRTKFFAGRDLDLPMYAPHELERTPKALELVSALREADAVVVGSPGYPVRCPDSSRTRSTTSRISARIRGSTSTNTPWGCISCAYGWQAASERWVSCAASGMRCVRGRRHLGLAINSAAEIWDGRGLLTDTGVQGQLDLLATQLLTFAPRSLGNGVTEFARKTILVDGLVTSYLEAGQGDPVVLLHGGEFGVSAEIGWEQQHRRAGGALTACSHRTCLGSAAPRRSSTSTTAAACGSGTSRGSAKRSASNRALRRQLDGRGQPLRRRHIGIPCCLRAAW